MTSRHYLTCLASKKKWCFWWAVICRKLPAKALLAGTWWLFIFKLLHFPHWQELKRWPLFNTRRTHHLKGKFAFTSYEINLMWKRRALAAEDVASLKMKSESWSSLIQDRLLLPVIFSRNVLIIIEKMVVIRLWQVSHITCNTIFSWCIKFLIILF